jgi:hypothetical protein
LKWISTELFLILSLSPLQLLGTLRALIGLGASHLVTLRLWGWTLAGRECARTFAAPAKPSVFALVAR